MTPTSWNNLAGTMDWQLAHLRIALSGEPIDSIAAPMPTRTFRNADTAPPQMAPRPLDLPLENWARWNNVAKRQRVLDALRTAGAAARTRDLVPLCGLSLGYVQSILYTGVRMGVVAKQIVRNHAEWSLLEGGAA